MDIDFFEKELLKINSEDKLADFCRKLVLHGIPYVFKNKESDYYEFRKKIALHFKVSFHEVYITGSGKLGFSPFKKTEFSLDSDIDVAIISTTLFDSIMLDISNFQYNKRDNYEVVSGKELRMYHDFLEYSAMGWIRPDKLPISFQIKIIKDNWFNFFEGISYNKSEVGNYKVAGGVFKSYEHFEAYTINGFDNLTKKLKLRVENE